MLLVKMISMISRENSDSSLGSRHSFTAGYAGARVPSLGAPIP